MEIQYDHIPPRARPSFANWLHCNDVAVIHLIRTAAIESFWTAQAELLDVAQLGRHAIPRMRVLCSPLF